MCDVMHLLSSSVSDRSSQCEPRFVGIRCVLDRFPRGLAGAVNIAQYTMYAVVLLFVLLYKFRYGGI
jgi:hypothetical protein